MAKGKNLITSRRKDNTSFDYMVLSDDDKQLIAKVCEHPFLVKIAPLTKGHSGANTFLGRIFHKIPTQSKKGKLTHTMGSKLYVFKIGAAAKIKYEFEKITGIAELLIKGFPPTQIAFSQDKKLAIIKQEFLGNDKGESVNLKNFIDSAVDHSTVFQVVDKLYKKEIIKWSDSHKGGQKEKMAFGKLLEPWLSKGVAGKSFRELCADLSPDSLEKLLLESYGLNFDIIDSLLKDIQKQPVKALTSPVHGDLHAENILVDTEDDNRISLIDFGWTDFRWAAVDFIWLECSLKYIVCSPSIGINTYTRAEDLVDDYWGKEDELKLDEIENLVAGKGMAKIAAGMTAIRSNIQSLKILDNLDDYRRGLILMTYSLLSVPRINKVYLIHSICNNLVKLHGRRRKQIPQYDRLYNMKKQLWPSTPGRMVVKANKLFEKSGTALDVGCGDGKNISYLLGQGWKVDGIDSSFLAISGAKARCGNHSSLKLNAHNACVATYTPSKYDLIVNYGLYHCLSESEVATLHLHLHQSLKPGGIMAFCMLNDTMPMPAEHGTAENIYLRPESYIRSLHKGCYETLELISDTIQEDHLPIIGSHQHGVTWGLFRKLLL